MNVILPDGARRELKAGATALDLALSISKGLAAQCVAAEVNGRVQDLSRPLSDGDRVTLLKFESDEGRKVFWHTSAHVMAQAVKSLFPETKVTIGPAIDNGFYYDFDRPTAFTPGDFAKIEATAAEIAARSLPLSRRELSRDEAMAYFERLGETYKTEILRDIPQGETISTYTQGDFTDLCRGPHLPHTGFVKAFKVLSLAGAYWRGSERNKMLQRIYAVSFPDQKRLDEHLRLLEEAKKRDHRKIGKELEIFFFDDEVGPGLPLWFPNGAVIIDELEKLAKETEDRAGYQRVRTPHLSKGGLYERSGHLAHYKESMFPPMNVDGIDYYVKPMNCPHHHRIFSAIPRSYRDMPLRLAEYGTCYRYEQSGELFGLMRVRSMQMNDAHIYCTPGQFKGEFLDVCRMYAGYLKIFGITKYRMRLSLHDSKDLGGKYVNEPELWTMTEAAVRSALKEGGVDFVESAGEAAFYGPKIDLQVWSAIGREFTLATNQVDFAVPKRFGLEYTAESGKPETPLCIHRAPLSTHERMIGFLLEQFAGDFPLWLSPVQAKILPISEKFMDYAAVVHQALRGAGIRAQLDGRADKVGAKIRDAELLKIPYMLVVGEKETADNSVSVRKRKGGDLGKVPLPAFVESLQTEIREKTLPAT